MLVLVLSLDLVDYFADESHCDLCIYNCEVCVGLVIV